MRIFLSYSSADREAAEEVFLALAAQHHDIFFDRESLPPGLDFHARIRSAIDQSDLLILLITRKSIERGSYTRTELKIASSKWPQASGRLLPVKLDEVPFEDLPAYVKSVTVLEPEGNLAAEVCLAVESMLTASKPRLRMEGSDAVKRGGYGRAWRPWIFVSAIMIAGLSYAVLNLSGWTGVSQPEPARTDTGTVISTLEGSPAPENAPVSTPTEPSSTASSPGRRAPVENAPSSNSASCSIRTGMIARLLTEPKIFSPHIALLRGQRTLVVKKTVIYNHGGLQKIPLYQVEVDGSTGWISNDDIDKVTGECGKS